MSSQSSAISTPLEIRYTAGADADAEDLARMLQDAGAPAGTVQAAQTDDARLAIGEIILTIVVSSALKAVLEVTLNALRRYLLSRINHAGIQGESQARRIQVVIRQKGAPQRKLFSFARATKEAVNTFMDELKKAAVDAVSAESK